VSRGIRDGSTFTSIGFVDDERVCARSRYPTLLQELGFAAHAFSSAEEFLTSDYVDQTRCSDPGHRHAGA